MLKFLFNVRSLIIAIAFASASCSSIRESPKYELTDGVYHSSFISRDKHKLYVEVHDDTIKAFRAIKAKKDFIVDRLNPVQTFPDEIGKKEKQLTLYKPSFDLDFITIPIKYRPESAGFPRTLTSTLSGALYIGGRYDLFRIKYKNTPLGTGERRINHYGLSAGIFTGLGSTFVAPWFTNNAIDSEYDGVVFMNGVAVLIGINQFSVGLAVGADNLLDKNDKFWIYENKPWVGVVFGLNLN